MEKTILKLLDRTEKILGKHLNEEYYIDDVSWGERGFIIRIFKYILKPAPIVPKADYMFLYDEEDEYSLSEQYREWFKETVMNMKELGILRG